MPSQIIKLREGVLFSLMSTATVIDFIILDAPENIQAAASIMVAAVIIELFSIIRTWLTQAKNNTVQNETTHQSG